MDAIKYLGTPSYETKLKNCELTINETAVNWDDEPMIVPKGYIDRDKWDFEESEEINKLAAAAWKDYLSKKYNIDFDVVLQHAEDINNFVCENDERYKKACEGDKFKAGAMGASIIRASHAIEQAKYRNVKEAKVNLYFGKTLKVFKFKV